MRVLFMVHTFPVLTETFVLNQITGLLDRDVDVEIFAFHWGQRADVEPAVERYGLLERVTCADVPRGRAARIARRIGLLARNAPRRPTVMARALNVARCGMSAASLTLSHAAGLLASKRPYDIVHCHFGPIGGLGADCRYAGAIGGALVTSFYGYDVSSYVKDRGGAPYRRLFAEGDLFFAICEPMRRRLIELGCRPESIRLHRIGIDTHRITPRRAPKPAGSPVRLFTIARLTEKKGLRYALQAVAQVHREYPALEYTIAGDGPLRTELEAFAGELGIRDAVRWLGNVRHDRVLELLEEADVFLLPSVTGADGDQEGTPVVLMEALAHEVPALTTQHSGIPEIVRDGESGFLVPERDVDALARQLRVLVERPDLRRELGAAGRKHVQREFDINRLNDNLLALYQSCLTR